MSVSRVACKQQPGHECSRSARGLVNSDPPYSHHLCLSGYQSDDPMASVWTSKMVTLCGQQMIKASTIGTCRHYEKGVQYVKAAKAKYPKVTH